MRTTAWLLTLLCLMAYAYFYNSAGANQMARYNQTRAIVGQGVLYSDSMHPRSHDVIHWDGHIYSNKAPGVSLMAVVPFALVDGLRRALGLDSQRAKNIAGHIVTILTVGVPSALLAALFFYCLIWMGAPPPGAALGTLALTLGTTYFPYASMFFGHSVAGAAAFAAFILIYRARAQRLEGPGEGRGEGRGIFFAALLVSFAVIIEYPLGLVAIALSIYLLMTWPTLKGWLQWGAGAGLGVSLLGLYNWICFGSPLALSYTRYAASEVNAFPDHEQGIGGVTLPKVEVLKAILWETERGLMYFAPILFFLTIPAFIFWFVKKRELWREGLTCLLILCLFLAFNAGYGSSIVYWGGANSAGPRHIIPMFPFVALPVAYLISQAPALFFLPVLGAISLALMVTAVMPQISMTYQHPMVQFIIPFYEDGRLLIHQTGMVGRKLVTSDSVAYPLGRLFGLDGTLSLLPLFLGAALLVGLILRQFKRAGQVSRGGALAAFGVSSLWMLGMLLWPLGQQGAGASPKAGQGAWGEYHLGQSCRSPGVYYEQMSDLDVNYVKTDLRPFPGPFCVRWISTLEVPESGIYQFQVRGQKVRFFLGGEEIPMSPPDPRKAKARGFAELEAGPHNMMIEAVIPGSHGTGGVDWLIPGEGARFQPIPPEALTLSEGNIKALGPASP